MMIEIAVETNEVGRFYTMTCGKTSMSVGVCRRWVSTCVHNAAAGLRRNLLGRMFHGADALDQAARSYKSGAVKAMIHAVQQAERALTQDQGVLQTTAAN